MPWLWPPIHILVTALALEHLARESHKTGFGSLRLWGSIGFAISSFGIGAILVDSDAIWWIIPIYALGNLVLGMIAYSFPDADIHGHVSWREGVTLLKREKALAWFLLGLLLTGITFGIANNFLSIYLTDINSAGWIIGAALAISAIFEVPLMARAQTFINRWGIRLVLIAGTAMLPLRWLLFAFIDQPLWVLPVQILHSIAMMSALDCGNSLH